MPTTTSPLTTPRSGFVQPLLLSPKFDVFLGTRGCSVETGHAPDRAIVHLQKSCLLGGSLSVPLRQETKGVSWLRQYPKLSSPRFSSHLLCSFSSATAAPIEHR